MHIALEQLQPNRDVIEKFLSDVVQTEIHLAAITPDGVISGKYFGSDVEAATNWVVDQNAQGRGLYYTTNKCHAGVTNKPNKQDIRKARLAHVDIDPPKDGSAFDKAATICALEALPTPPTFIVDSGNGVQALWKLEEDVDDLERVEAINRGIAQRFAGDSGHNIDRLLRVPGTVNYPNAAKRKRGCVAVMAKFVSLRPDRLSALEVLEREFPLAAALSAPARASVAVPDEIVLLTSADLSRGDTAKLSMMLDQPDKHFRNADRSAWAYGIACQMNDDRYPDDDILGILLNTANAGCAHVGDQSNPLRAAKRALSRAKARYIPTGGSIFAKSCPPNSNRPTIRIEGGALAEEVDQVEQALIAADLDYFQMGERIVRTGDMHRAKVGLTGGSHSRIFDVSEAELVETFTTVAEWVKPLKSGDAKVNCPPLIAETYMARKGKWRLPPLVGLTDVPTIRRDGSILAVPGYDGSTGLLFKPSGTKVPAVPQSPTKADALAALNILKTPLAGFPFVDETDRSVALSILMTSTCRTALGSAPLHAISAPTAGSGKSTIIDLACILRTGRVAATIAQGKTEEELEKRLASMFLEGDGFVAIDNCESPLGGEFLCQALTQSTLKVRPLGKSTVIEVPTAAVMTATGNNLTVFGDMNRRTLLCQLDPGVERPELRQFSFDPVEVVLAQRGAMVAAALTVLRAYHVAGRPHQVSPLGSFADWSNLVRSALIWLGCADPCDTMEKVRKADPALAQIKAVMAQWTKVIGQKKVTTGDLNTQAEEMVEVSLGSSSKKPKYPEFRDALLAVAGEGARINGRKLGKWLSKYEDRVVNGRKFLSPGTRGGQSVWILEMVAPSPNAAPAEGD